MWVLSKIGIGGYPFDLSFAWFYYCCFIKLSRKYQSIRNIPFARRPKYSWIFDASVTVEELVEEIVIKREKDDKTEAELPEYTGKNPETSESSNNATFLDPRNTKV